MTFVFVLLQRFQEDLRAQQPNVEKIVTMADEILQACHPSAVRFVRYYLTITHTRWEQAVNRSNQRMQRLQEALRNMRGNAALLEDLLTWLTEAHALLTAKEKDPIPGDLTVVEVLVKEHLVRVSIVYTACLIGQCSLAFSNETTIQCS